MLTALVGELAAALWGALCSAGVVVFLWYTVGRWKPENGEGVRGLRRLRVQLACGLAMLLGAFATLRVLYWLAWRSSPDLMLASAAYPTLSLIVWAIGMLGTLVVIRAMTIEECGDRPWIFALLGSVAFSVIMVAL